MITTYLTTLKVAFNPFQPTSRIPRLFLNLLSPQAHKTIKINATQFPRASTDPAVLELGFKDGKTVKYSWSADALEKRKSETERKKVKWVGLQEIVEEVDRHARVSARKEELSG
ncbi:uncharacterized protein Z518_08835 [Rhinocladiella mackenziei CBS 650.93]|uniref:Large ribosomal subunit protein mL53 n=1 Tax=Rhinocladiella mackenziei CBS 650.93 TaxID=1442369 RepID=A0A0D2FLM3_9EURO|nr:uncharacterized protein Z518_08835 [Rhinocladiella mackenziei CBS 650.93]KIX02892.1 hypothetical protein Z518_08835 [Rhinocladiella mackenziei CBS 650.93]